MSEGCLALTSMSSSFQDKQRSQCTGGQLHQSMVRPSALGGCRGLGSSHCSENSEEACGVSWGEWWVRHVSKTAGKQLELVKQGGQWSQLQVVPHTMLSFKRCFSFLLLPLTTTTSKAQGHCDEYHRPEDKKCHILNPVHTSMRGRSQEVTVQELCWKVI